MKLFLKTICGNTIALDVELDTEIVDTFVQAFEKRHDKLKNATIENYAKAVQWLSGARQLNFGKTWRDYNMVEHATINEVLKAWTMSPGFSFETLSMECPISLQDMASPYLLNPGCCHAFDQVELKALLKSGHKICPLCRADIDPFHVKQLQ
jgi:hypothetical protein